MQVDRHTRLHTGEKPYKCVFCVYRSAWKGDMKRHVVKHHAPQIAMATSLEAIIDTCCRPSAQTQDKPITKSEGGQTREENENADSAQKIKTEDAEETARSSGSEESTREFAAKKVDADERKDVNAENKDREFDQKDAHGNEAEQGVGRQTCKGTEQGVKASPGTRSEARKDHNGDEHEKEKAKDSDKNLETSGRQPREHPVGLRCTLCSEVCTRSSVEDHFRKVHPEISVSEDSNPSDKSNSASTDVNPIESDSDANAADSRGTKLKEMDRDTEENNNDSAKLDEELTFGSLNGKKYRPYKCSACPRRSNWRWDIMKHIRRIHPTAKMITLSEEVAKATFNESVMKKSKGQGVKFGRKPGETSESGEEKEENAEDKPNGVLSFHEDGDVEKKSTALFEESESDTKEDKEDRVHDKETNKNTAEKTAASEQLPTPSTVVKEKREEEKGEAFEKKVAIHSSGSISDNLECVESSGDERGAGLQSGRTKEKEATQAERSTMKDLKVNKECKPETRHKSVVEAKSPEKGTTKQLLGKKPGRSVSRGAPNTGARQGDAPVTSLLSTKTHSGAAETKALPETSETPWAPPPKRAKVETIRCKGRKEAASGGGGAMAKARVAGSVTERIETKKSGESAVNGKPVARTVKRYKCFYCPYRSNYRSDIGRHGKRLHRKLQLKVVILDEDEAASTLQDYRRKYAKKKFVLSPSEGNEDGSEQGGDGSVEEEKQDKDDSFSGNEERSNKSGKDQPN